MIKTETREWLIWSIEHDAWWKPNYGGYTKNKDEAGRYGYSQALKIVREANMADSDMPNEAMIFCGLYETNTDEPEYNEDVEMSDLS